MRVCHMHESREVALLKQADFWRFAELEKSCQLCISD